MHSHFKARPKPGLDREPKFSRQRSNSENALKSGGEALVAAKLCLQFFFLDHPDLQLHLDNLERTDVPGGGIERRHIHCRKPPRRQIEDVRSAAAELCQKEMRCCRELQPHRNQCAVNLHAYVAGKLKNKASRARLHVGTATDPCPTIGNDSAEPGYNHGLVFGQERR